MSGFAEEVKQSQSTRSEAPPPELPAGNPEPGAAEAALFNSQAGEAPKSEAPGAQASPSAEVASAEPAVETPKIKIGLKSFNSVDEAVAYAQELELAKAQDEAFRQGVEAGKPKPEAVVEKSIDERIEEKLFENPKQAIKELRESIVAEVKAAYQQDKEQEIRAVAAKAAQEKTWTEFYASNNDLAGYEELVQGHFLQKYWGEVGHIPLNEGLARLADKVRADLKISKEKSLPGRELPSGGAVMASGSGVTPAAAPAEDKPIDFMSQMAKLRKRKT